MAIEQAEPDSDRGEARRWYQDAIIYELHVRAFADSNGDGVGDFRGLCEKLDYLQDLGVTAIWLLPFFPSPLQDDGYDIADYTAVHPAYGTLADFETFLAEAHRRRLRVIIELVLNHTSDQHPWFQRARRAPRGSIERAFYVWSDTPERYSGTRIIFQDYEHSNWAWDGIAEQYFWHRFYHHQPDLNYDNPAVRKAIFDVVDFWFGLGVDGLRLDAVPYLYERDGTPSENLAPTHAFLKQLRAHIDTHYPERMLLAEANQWPEDAAAYFGEGDECQMAFHFPLMPRLFMAVRTENRFPIVDILAQTPPLPDGCQWAIFLRNHDELTLEMVTEEERIVMYRAYARMPEARINQGIRRRLAPLLGNDRRQIELLTGLLCALPGTPVLYYGDEIGMGDNIYLGDRDGVRTPMQWSADRNAGFSRANPQQLYLPLITDYEYHHEAVHVEAQQQNPHSLLNWTKRLLDLRKRSSAFGHGSTTLLDPANQKVLAFVRCYENETILVVANLSRFFQHAQLDLSPFAECIPVELFGQTHLPPIDDAPYVLTLGAYAIHWFALQKQPVTTVDPTTATDEHRIPTLKVEGRWTTLLQGSSRSHLAGILPGYLRAQPWFPHKARTILATRVEDLVGVPDCQDSVCLTLIRVEYAEGEPELFNVPLAFATGERAVRVRRDYPLGVLAQVHAQGDEQHVEGILYDAVMEPDVATALMDLLVQECQLAGVSGSIRAHTSPDLRERWHASVAVPTPTLNDGRQNNSTLRYGDLIVFKLFRRLDEGVNPEVEIGQYLNDHRFAHAPLVVGTLAYERSSGVPMTLATLRTAVVHKNLLWDETLAVLDLSLTAARGTAPPGVVPFITARLLLDATNPTRGSNADAILGSYRGVAQLLGRRTAELHNALAGSDDPSFVPESFTPLYQRSLYQSLRSLTSQTLRTLRVSKPSLDTAAQEHAQQVLDAERRMVERFGAILTHLEAKRIRCHGDLHLGQILWTGEDVVFIDFEGEPGRPLLERQLKRCALWDLAGLIQSFAYLVQVWLSRPERPTAEPADVVAARAMAWQLAASRTLVQAYIERAAIAGILPSHKHDLVILLDVYLLHKAVNALDYELNHRRAWVPVALRSLLPLLELPLS